MAVTFEDSSASYSFEVPAKGVHLLEMGFGMPRQVRSVVVSTYGEKGIISVREVAFLRCPPLVSGVSPRLASVRLLNGPQEIAAIDIGHREIAALVPAAHCAVVPARALRHALSRGAHGTPSARSVVPWTVRTIPRGG